MERSKDDAFRELEIFLRAAAKAIGREDSIIKRLSDGFEIDDQDVECRWAEDAHAGEPGWQIVIYYAELDLLTDESKWVGPEVVRTFAAGEEADVATQALLTVVGNWIESALSHA